jgi:Asp-tRNA(Asn)/Glu-tRNA(Gln) amidotransferase A subunit family amidase
MSGLPATVAPTGHDERDLPIGVPIIGGYLEDRTTISVRWAVQA